MAADEIEALAPGAAEVARARRIMELADDTLAGYDLHTGARIGPSRDAGTETAASAGNTLAQSDSV